MADMTQREENLRAFREQFNLIRVELSIAASPESVIDVFSVVDITIAKNLIIDLVRILVLQSQPNALTVPSQNDHAIHLSNLFSLGSNVFTDSFNIKLAIPLIEQVLNNEPEQKIRSVVSKLAARARLLFTPPAPSRKVASETQFSASNQVTESNSSTNYDETESRAVKRVKLTHGVLHENDCIGTGRKCDMGTPYPDNSYEPALERSPLFQYQPLKTSRREIRLLILHPGADILGPFSYSCNLVHVSMDEDPDYEALSYVWGSEPNKQKILIDGRQLSVTPNLAEALNYLSDCDMPRKLWVDVICINQDDISERSHQVQNMTEIYARARNVVVWIGVLGITTQNFLHRVEKSEDDDRTPRHLRRWTASGVRIPANISAFNEEDMRLLCELAQNPWFKRVWVIQEVAVAREVIVQTGRTTISWSVFCTALEECINKQEMKSVIEAARTINKIRTARSRKPYYMDLFTLLERFRHCLATDERDKVFALLGLASSSLVQEKVVQVTLDYSKPAVDIFKSLARQYITKRKNLDIICHATLPNHMPIPSWVPCWSWHDPGLSVLPKRCTMRARHKPMYRCCGDLELDRELLFGTELSGNILWLNGFKFDVVFVIGSVATKVEDLGLELPINGVTDLLKEWRSMSEICRQTYGSNLEEAFRRTLLADALGEKRYQTQSTLIAYETDGCALIDDSISKSSFDYVYLIEGRLAEAEKESQPLLEEQLNSKIDRSDASVRRAALKRAFFVTEKGYMGLGPSNMEEGDLVYVLSGGQVPFILRPIILADGFSLVGESYIHGIMDGEATVLGIEIETLYLI